MSTNIRTVPGLTKVNGWLKGKWQVVKTVYDLHVRMPLNYGDLAGAGLVWKERAVPEPKFWRLGVIGDEDGMKMATHEQLAFFLASELDTGGNLLELCCGVGSQTIQFVEHARRIFAIDIDAVKLKCAIHNAKIYGARKKITFIRGDMNDDQLLRSFAGRVSVVILDSPIWSDLDAYERYLEKITTLIDPERIAIRLPKGTDQKMIMSRFNPTKVIAYGLQRPDVKFYVVIFDKSEGAARQYEEVFTAPGIAKT